MGEDDVRAAYREPKVDEGAPAPNPDLLSYFPEEARRGASDRIGFIFLPALAVCGVVSAVSGSVALGLVAALGVLVWPIVRRKRAKAIPRATLRIEGGLLHLSGPAFDHPVIVNLNDLLDVYLDTKTIQRLLRESPGPVPMLRFINATVGGEHDVARIALELSKETFFLTTERVSHLDANEWFSKIRRFLRQHDWIPEDERSP